MSDPIDTSAEAVEALLKRLRRKASLKEHGMWCSTMDDAAAALRTLLAERDAALAEAARLREFVEHVSKVFAGKALGDEARAALAKEADHDR